MLRIGIVGIGFMGMIHYYGIRKVSGAEVVAICTRDPKKLDGDWTSIQGNFGPRGGIENLSHLRRYNRIEDFLADPDVDLVDICLPVQLHKAVSIAALEAGKHVLVEKPISIRLDDATEMVEVGIASGRHFMVAHVLPFFAEFAYAKNAVESVAVTDNYSVRISNESPPSRRKHTIRKNWREAADRGSTYIYMIHTSSSSFAGCPTPYSPKGCWQPAILPRL